MPFVIVTASGTKDLAAQTCTIGNEPEADVVLDDPAVGPKQAVIQEINGVYILRDAGQLGPTYVNDRPVTEVILTKKGTIRIGRMNLKFSRPTPASPLTIEYRAASEPSPVAVTDAAATLVLKTSPVVRAADPDATQKIEPIPATNDDPDKTMVLPKPEAPPS